ncbi:MAG: PorT family protein [Bacteroidetes bacterium]|uniref:PorT family protein n=1 Tax=Candidatus Cryptobacteroides excrementipullorum TaxID=2840761 RepID=A0A9D9IUJ6_9BACT|nr:PorT family protein [Candidatus Cryptobacteroides excrementipullorum]
MKGMKNRLATVLAAAVLLFSLFGTQASAQGRFGVIGGMTFSNAERQALNRSTMNKYHVGVTYQLKLPLGFSVQPSLMYHVKGAKLSNVIPGADFTNTSDLTIGYLELPVSLQWGPDLLLFRPFLDVSPYIGYGLNNRMDAYIENLRPSEPVRNDWSELNRWEYGLGVGVGIEIWKFQVIGRYNWNFGSLYGHDDASEPDTSLVGIMREAFSRGHNLGGFTLSVSLLF